MDAATTSELARQISAQVIVGNRSGTGRMVAGMRRPRPPLEVRIKCCNLFERLDRALLKTGRCELPLASRRGIDTSKHSCRSSRHALDPRRHGRRPGRRLARGDRALLAIGGQATDLQRCSGRRHQQQFRIEPADIVAGGGYFVGSMPYLLLPSAVH
jgi:hypothetical protein